MRCSLRFLCDWFVSREWMFYDGYYDGDNWDDEDKSKISKTLNKRRCPSRYWDWCISEDEKQEIIRSKKFFDLKRSTK